MTPVSDPTPSEPESEIWSCSRCGPSPDSTAGWCALGCGRDYNRMSKIESGPPDLTGEQRDSAVGRRVRHYKGGIYTIVATPVMHTETEEPLVVYVSPGGRTWARPSEMFWGRVEVDGNLIRRFVLLPPHPTGGNVSSAPIVQSPVGCGRCSSCRPADNGETVDAGVRGQSIDQYRGTTPCARALWLGRPPEPDIDQAIHDAL